MQHEFTLTPDILQQIAAPCHSGAAGVACRIPDNPDRVLVGVFFRGLIVSAAAVSGFFNEGQLNPFCLGKAVATQSKHIVLIAGRAAFNEKAVMIAVVFINAARNEFLDIYNDFRVFAGNVDFANFGGRVLHGVTFGELSTNRGRSGLNLSRFYSLFTL